MNCYTQRTVKFSATVPRAGRMSTTFRPVCSNSAFLGNRRTTINTVQGVQKSRIFSAEKATAIKKIGAEELEVAIQKRECPLVIDFYATWCGPCVLMVQELEKVAEELGENVKILKIDTDENPELSSQLRIQALPTLMFVSTDTEKPALRVEGFVPSASVIDIIKNEL